MATTIINAVPRIYDHGITDGHHCPPPPLAVEEPDHDYLNIWLAPGNMFQKVVQQPVGIGEIETRANGERVIAIDTSRLEP